MSLNSFYPEPSSLLSGLNGFGSLPLLSSKDGNKNRWIERRIDTKTKITEFSVCVATADKFGSINQTKFVRFGLYQLTINKTDPYAKELVFNLNEHRFSCIHAANPNCCRPGHWASLRTKASSHVANIWEQLVRG